MTRRGTVTAALVLAALVLTGCERGSDADRDGVADAADRCAATPAGDAADAEGCSAAQRALARGLSALAADTVANIGTVWMMQLLARADPDLGLQTLIERSVAALRADPGIRLVDPTAPRVVLPAEPDRGILRLVTFLQAPIGEPPPRAIDFIAQFLSTDEHGYVLTHQLLALLWATDQGLSLPATLTTRKPQLLARIAAEQETQPAFTDLFVERSALLLGFDAPPRAAAAGWIATIVAAQQGDGRWVDDVRSSLTYDGQTAPAKHEWTHTSGFAVSALWFYLHCCAADVPTCGGTEGGCADLRPPTPSDLYR